jgi:YidC/Oxa1 family membrane protein insertase
MAVHQSFGWVNDLCQPDQLYILPVIAGVATYISMKFTTAMSGNPQVGGASMKAMQYFMPVMIAWMATTLPAGVSLYWIISYIFQIFQIIITKYTDQRRREKEEIRKRETKKLKQTHKKKTTAM